MSLSILMGDVYPILDGVVGQPLYIIRIEDVELSGAENNSTNNRMELTAAINALESLTGSPQVQVFTDSEYVKKGITEWLPNWRNTGLETEGRDPGEPGSVDASGYINPKIPDRVEMGAWSLRERIE